MSKMTAHTEELERQLAEKAETYQLLEVLSSHTPCMLHSYSYNNCVVPMYINMYMHIRPVTAHEMLY